jgi:hypothetical protein
MILRGRRARNSTRSQSYAQNTVCRSFWAGRRIFGLEIVAGPKRPKITKVHPQRCIRAKCGSPTVVYGSRTPKNLNGTFCCTKKLHAQQKLFKNHVFGAFYRICEGFPKSARFWPKNAGIAFKSNVYVQNCGSKPFSVD